MFTEHSEADLVIKTATRREQQPRENYEPNHLPIASDNVGPYRHLTNLAIIITHFSS